MRFDYMICPVHNLGVSAWSSVSCVPNPVFVWKEWEIWRPVAAILSNAVSSSFIIVVWHGIDLPRACRIARMANHNDPLCAIPIPPPGHVMLRLAGRAVWRLLRFGIQACVRRQRLWGQHSWPRRNDRPNGLPVRIHIFTSVPFPWPSAVPLRAWSSPLYLLHLT